MQEFSKTYQKGIAGLVLMGIIFTAVLLPFQRAESSLPFGPMGLTVPTNDWLTNIKEYIVDEIPYLLAGVILRTLTDSIVSWIRTGGVNGGSLMIDNFEEHFKRELDNAAGIFLQDIIGPEFVDLLCEPLRISIPRFAAGLRPSFADRARCTITEIVDNLENFRVSFVQGGSWQAWDSLLEPNNNWMGVLLSVIDEGERRKYEAFFSTNKKIDTTGGGLSPYEDCDTDSLGHIVNCVIKTPGKVVAEAVKETFTVDVDRLKLADEINEIIAAALDSLISWAITGGGGGYYSASSVKRRDSTHPIVDIISPRDGATVLGIVTISASAFDDRDVESVRFFVDGREIDEVDSPPYSTAWDTRTVSDGTYIIMVIATDTTGNVDQSIASVTVRNSFTPPPPPPPAGGESQP